MSDDLSPEERRKLMEAYRPQAEEIYNNIKNFVEDALGDGIEQMTDEEVDAELRKAGRNPEGVGKIGELTAQNSILRAALAERDAQVGELVEALRKAQATLEHYADSGNWDESGNWKMPLSASVAQSQLGFIRAALAKHNR